MQFPFQDRKTAQAAAHLIKLAGGRLNYMVLIKLLYLADREMLLNLGVPITGDRMVSMDNGPVLSKVLDFVNMGKRANHTDGSAWFEYVSDPTGYDVGLAKADPENDELSVYELRLLAGVFDRYGRMDKWDLVKLLHGFPELADPGGSCLPIAPENILRAESRSEDEIKRVNAGADELRLLASLGP